MAQCASVGANTEVPDTMILKACSSACFEMVIPFSNQYHYLRGCHADFIETGATTQTVASDDKCTFSKVPDQLIYNDPKTDIQTAAVAVVHFVKYEEEKRVNVEYVSDYFGAKDALDKLAKVCTEAPAVNCVKSIYYDGTGEDNNKDSCTGGYCTSVEGKLNGRKYIERGCAPISPYTQNTCFSLYTNSTFVAGPGSGGTLSRTKRSLTAILDAYECICTSQYCNTSSTQLLYTLFTATIACSLARFLY